MSRGMHDGPPPADGGAHAAPQQEQQGVAAAASRTPSPRPGPGGPPRLSRHSAPVPGVLVRLSPTLLFFPPAAGSELQLSSFGSPLGGSALQAAGSADVEPLSTPDHSSEAGEASEGSEGVEVDADAMVAAAETAALPRSPKSEAHLSLTRLMGEAPCWQRTGGAGHLGDKRSRACVQSVVHAAHVLQQGCRRRRMRQ